MSKFLIRPRTNHRSIPLSPDLAVLGLVLALASWMPSASATPLEPTFTYIGGPAGSVQFSPVTFVAAVTGTNLTGTVTFLTPASIPGCVDLPLTAGQAQCTTMFFNTGEVYVVAHYSGDPLNAPSDSTALVHTVSVPSSYLLEVVKSGTGTGAVSSTPAGIDCGVDCSESFAAATVVTLTAVPGTGSAFTRWDGVYCAEGTFSPVCTMLGMSADQQAVAVFDLLTFTVTSAPDGAFGTLGMNPGSCTGGCFAVVPYGTLMTLSASPGGSASFLNWTGVTCNEGPASTLCTFTVTGNVSATAHFGYALILTKSALGSVTSNPPGINCGSSCTFAEAVYAPGTIVTLVAQAGAGASFAGWGGGSCSGTGDCIVNVNTQIGVLATFNAAATAPLSGFNGDARSDVFWRDTTSGLNYQWQMNGLALSGQGYMPSVPSNWMVAGVGDVNGNGIADVLWREAGGLNYLWLMNGLTVATQGYLPTVVNPWIVVGLGDANGDGKADVFWRNPTSGQNYLWIMNGLAIASQGYMPSVAGPDWEAVGVADYSGDGKTDVFWRNKSTGQNYLWVMNGLVVSSQGYLTTIASTDWEVVGSPDANGDGKADVLWRHKVTGQNYLWVMNGLAIASQGYLPTIADANWKIVGFGDYNGDGKGDVLWRHATSGQNYLWALNGISVASQGYLPSVGGANWKPVK